MSSNYSDALQIDRAAFEAKIDKSAGSMSCWPWKKGRDKDGYGRLNINGKRDGAHRVAYMLASGPIPDGLFVLHCCDNPPCCNWRHLFVGTLQDNAADRLKKGRSAKGDLNGARLHPERLARGKKHGSYQHPESVVKGRNHYAIKFPEKMLRGEKHGMAKLFDQDVIEIRLHYAIGDVSQRELAKEYNVSNSTIHLIVRNKKWIHLLPK